MKLMSMSQPGIHGLMLKMNDTQAMEVHLNMLSTACQM
jgi:hypothetical protein